MQILDCELLRHLFRIDDVSGKFFWKNPPHTHPRLLGLEAGGPRRSHNGKEYWVIRIGGIGHKRGRLMHLAIHGELPIPCVDHINGDSLDDRPPNLRQATVTENAWNHKKRARKQALPMGVRLIPASGRFQARIGVNKKQIHLGSYDTPEEAAAVYAAKRKEYFHEFA